MSNSIDNRLFDVARPGKSLPEPTSRPVIVSNRPIVKDPTLKPDEKSEDPEIVSSKADKQVSSVSNEGKNIEPTDQAKEEASKDTAQTEAESTDSENQTDDQNLEPALVDKKKQNAAEDAEKAHQAEVDKMITEGTYALPIRKSKRHRNTTKILIISVVVLVIGLVTVDLLIDAGIIKTSINPVVDLIKN